MRSVWLVMRSVWLVMRSDSVATPISHRRGKCYLVASSTWNGLYAYSFVVVLLTFFAGIPSIWRGKYMLLLPFPIVISTIGVVNII